MIGGRQKKLVEDIHSNAYKYESTHEFYPLARQRIVLELIGHIKSDRKEFHHIIDIGSNNPGFPNALRKIFPEGDIKLIDIDRNRVKLLSESGFDAMECDVSSEKLPFPDGYFDLVHAGEIIEHLYDTDFFLDEVKRVMKPNGIFILTTPNLAAWYNRILLLFFGIQPFHTEVSLDSYYGRYPFKKAGGRPVGHIHVFTAKAVKEMVSSKGFRVLKIRGYPVLEKNKLDRLISHLPSWASGVIIILST